MDMKKLMMSKFEVLSNDSSSHEKFIVKFRGPPDTPYGNGTWNVRVGLPEVLAHLVVAV